MCGCLDNKIGDDGARALAEALEVNSTLTNLHLRSACCFFHHDMRVSSHSMMRCCLGSNIGDRARALAAALKVNSTVTNLDLSSACCLLRCPML